MKLLKKLGLMLVGATVATVIIYSVFLNARVSKLENVQSQIVQALQRPQSQGVSK